MKKTISFVSLVLVLTVINAASAELVNGISFISQEYSAGGQFSATVLTGSDKDGYPVWGNAQDSYSLPAQSNPIDYDYTYFHSSGNSFEPTNVLIGHNSGDLSVSTYACVHEDQLTGSVSGYTSGIWDFQPQYSDLKLNFDISYTQRTGIGICSIALSDLTTNTSLFNEYITANDFEIYNLKLNYNPSYSVDPTHIYRLTLNSFGSSQPNEGYQGGGIEATMSSINNTSSVPEPATLLILGLGGMFLRKRKA